MIQKKKIFIPLAIILLIILTEIEIVEAIITPNLNLIKNDHSPQQYYKNQKMLQDHLVINNWDHQLILNLILITILNHRLALLFKIKMLKNRGILRTIFDLLHHFLKDRDLA